MQKNAGVWVLSLLLVTVSCSLRTLAQSVPPGWRTTRPAPGLVVYTPPDLNSNEIYSVALFPAHALGGRPLEEYLRETAAGDPLKPGTVSGPLQVRPGSTKVVAGVQIYKTPDGRTVGGIYTAASPDGENARLSRVVFTNGLFARYKAATLRVTGAMLNNLKSSSSDGQAAAGTEQAPKRVLPPKRVPQAGGKAAGGYLWVTAPGQGLKPGQVAGIWHFYDVRLTPGGVGGLNTDITDESYLLLTDGTIHRGLPVPPDQLDVVRSRRSEPQAWGHWHRVGGKIAAAWAETWAERGFRTLPGSMAVAAPAGLRLAGRWGTGSSSASMVGGSYRLWGVTFTQNGRFVKDGSGGSGNSLFMQSGGQPVLNSTYDDNGSSTSVQGGNFTVGTGKRKTPGGDRSGSYSLSGYVLTLHYDSGQTVRLPFFFGEKTHNTLWFEGAQLARDEEKR